METPAPTAHHGEDDMFGKKGNKGLLDQVEEIAEELADRIAPHVDAAREQLAPVIADAIDKAQPYVDEARDRFNDDIKPAVTAAVSDARDKAAPFIADAREEASRRGKATAAALKGEVDAPKKGGKLKKVLIAGGLVGIASFVVSKLKGGQPDTSWQSSYVPPTPPTPKPTPAPASSTDSADDAAGASPDEAASDAAEAPHAVTTPDNPVEETEVDKPPAS